MNPVLVPTEKPTARPPRPKLLRLLAFYWNQIINVGVQPQMPAAQWKRVRLLNGIACITIAIYAGYVVVFFDSSDWITFRICLAGLFLNLPPLLFNYYRRYDAAAYYSVLSVTVLCSAIAIVRKYDGTEYFLLANSIVPMLFFRSLWKVLLLFAINLAAFFGVRHLMSVTNIYLYVPESAHFFDINVLLVFVALFVVVYYFRVENRRQEQLLSRRNESLRRSLERLRTTQTLLVQQEKMASLGALTAGIAHEIQNPLNFVNNFSDLASELLTELEEQQRAAARDVQPDGRIMEELHQSLRKIHHHGKRAETIVRGMLQHSRSSTSQRQATDLNALADEYWRLAYHSMQAKQPDFKVQFTADLDRRVGQVEVVAEDLGRVLLNLLTNAFYAVQQKARQLPAEVRYVPTVVLSTRREANGVELRVRDNGTGMAPEVLDKIFQPFFTTKPPGEGTGLGLSLSYSIVTKDHGGTLTAFSEEGKYSEFVVWLPE